MLYTLFNITSIIIIIIIIIMTFSNMHELPQLNDPDRR